MAQRNFIGRKKELDLLNQCYASGKSSFVPIYGRRRVGKSELILQFLANKRALYYVGKEAPAKLQLREFMQLAARSLDRPSLAMLEATTWRDALDAVSSEWTHDEPLILALDEFQWMVNTSPELPSVIQELWDRRWKPAGNVVLVICGSFVGFMEREILGRKSPLFGRRTGQILLRPFDFREASEFHKRMSLTDRAMIHFVCGGVPAYLEHFSPSCSVEMNIQQTLFSDSSALFREPDFLLREELRDLEGYYAILDTLARGSSHAQEIAQSAGLKATSLHYYLRTLVDLGYVSRVYPLTIQRAKRRDVRYMLSDPLLRFWFRFVEPNLTLIQQLGPKVAMAEQVKPNLDAYFGRCFELLCQEALPALLQKRGATTAIDVGSYWDKTVQIDVVGLRHDNTIELGECKWGSVRSAKALEVELENKIRRYPNHDNRTIFGNVFVRSKPRRLSATQFTWWDIDDLYGNSR